MGRWSDNVGWLIYTRTHAGQVRDTEAAGPGMMRVTSDEREMERERKKKKKKRLVLVYGNADGDQTTWLSP